MQMYLSRQYKRLQTTMSAYPRSFWTLVLATFIDRLGGAILFPFFTLYVTRKFDVGMTTVGLIFGIFSLTGIIGSTIGGALADRWGRKPMLVTGLIVSALSSLWLGTVNELDLFILGAMITGVFSRVGGPAQQALVADILPEEQRPQGYGIIRVTFNLSVTLGPAIGGLLATQSYLSLFIADAVSSLAVATIVLLVLPETLSKTPPAQPESVMSTFKGYGQVIRDQAFIFFFLASTLSAMVYLQMNSTLAVYLRDFHGISEHGFGYLLSMNAAMVVFFQFYVTRKIRGYAPMLMITIGTLLYALGFSMYGFTSTYAMFLLAMIVITFGEMLVAPVGQALVAEFAPDSMRARYMAFFGYSWAIPFAFAPTLAGLLIDNGNPNLVWYLGGVIGMISTAMYYRMYLQRARMKVSAVAYS
jgi:MFS family permease